MAGLPMIMCRCGSAMPLRSARSLKASSCASYSVLFLLEEKNAEPLSKPNSSELIEERS
ncbi:hypothetical protein D3C73_1586190 [compost metagenome]